jgi:hypothetical protein
MHDMMVVLFAAALSAQPPELGAVSWRRGYDAARDEARKRGVPLLVLFDEVPGCSTVLAYGKDVLSHPLVVDAAAHFVPVFVSNNSGGDDRRVLEAFREPSWNNPVLRIVDADGRPLSARITHDAGLNGLLSAMNDALGDRAPPWLPLVVDAPVAAQATYAVGCFWEGEAQLGAVEGVRATRPGFVDGHEVVRVEIEPGAEQRVAEVARARGYRALPGRFRDAPRDDKHALTGTAYARVPMTEAQRARVNAALAAGRDPLPYLSPTQRRAVDDDRARAALKSAGLMP